MIPAGPHLGPWSVQLDMVGARGQLITATMAETHGDFGTPALLAQMADSGESFYERFGTGKDKAA